MPGIPGDYDLSGGKLYPRKGRGRSGGMLCPGAVPVMRQITAGSGNGLLCPVWKDSFRAVLHDLDRAEGLG